MRFNDTRLAKSRTFALAAILLAALAACTEAQKPLGECEPGVSELGALGTAAPGTC